MLALFLVWFAGIAENFATFLWWVFGVGGLIFGGITFFTMLVNSESSTPYPYPLQKRWGKWMIAVCLASGLTASLIPSEKTVYLMGGAYLGQAVVQSEAAEKVTRILNGKLDSYLTEMEASVTGKKSEGK